LHFSLKLTLTGNSNSQKKKLWVIQGKRINGLRYNGAVHLKGMSGLRGQAEQNRILQGLKGRLLGQTPGTYSRYLSRHEREWAAHSLICAKM